MSGAPVRRWSSVPFLQIELLPRALPRSRLSRSRTWVVGLGVLVCALGAHPVSAQFSDASRVSDGDTVRIRLPRAMPVKASVVGMHNDVMVMRVEGLDGPWGVSLFDMTSLEVFTDRTPREGFRHGAILGGVSGLFIGAAVGIVLHTTGVTDDPSQPPGKLMTDALRGAGLGVIGGALAFGFYGGSHPGRGWIGIALPRN